MNEYPYDKGASRSLRSAATGVLNIACDGVLALYPSTTTELPFT